MATDSIHVALSMRMAATSYRVPSSVRRAWDDGSILIAFGVGCMAFSGTALYMENKQQAIYDLVRTDLWEDYKRNTELHGKRLKKIGDESALCSAEVTTALRNSFHQRLLSMWGASWGTSFLLFFLMAQGNPLRTFMIFIFRKNAWALWHLIEKPNWWRKHPVFSNSMKVSGFQ